MRACLQRTDFMRTSIIASLHSIGLWKYAAYAAGVTALQQRRSLVRYATLPRYCTNYAFRASMPDKTVETRRPWRGSP